MGTKIDGLPLSPQGRGKCADSLFALLPPLGSAFFANRCSRRRTCRGSSSRSRYADCRAPGFELIGLLVLFVPTDAAQGGDRMARQAENIDDQMEGRLDAGAEMPEPGFKLDIGKRSEDAFNQP